MLSSSQSSARWSSATAPRADRTALAAIDNAESIPLDESRQAGAIELSAVGAGRTDAPRRLLTEQDMIDIVLREANDYRAAAKSLADVEPDAARQLRLDAGLLRALVGDAGSTRSGDDIAAV